MLELANMLILKDLPTGVIVGTAVIAKCEEVEDRKSKIADSEGTSSPSSNLHPPSSLFHVHPQPVWFMPF